MLKYWKYQILIGANIVVKTINIFNYPVYTEDEGTYVSQAIAILEHGSLSYYTYWYDHAPGGWIILSIWHKIIEYIPYQLSNHLNEGRLFMVIISSITLYCIIQLLRRINIPQYVILTTGLVYTLSPLAIYYHRSIFLDNMMIMWIFISTLLITQSNRLWYAAASGTALGIALLTKETAVFFIPFLLLFLWNKKDKDTARFAIPIWLTFAAIVVLQYPTLALLKGEFFPASSLFGNSDQVSLLDTLLFQNNRKEVFWSETSSLRTSLRTSWLQLDPALIIIGISATLSNLLSRHRKNISIGFLFAAGYVFYLLKWQALEWYIIPLIPVFLVSIAVWLTKQTENILGKSSTQIICLFLVFSSVISLYHNQDVFKAKGTEGQLHAITWAREHIQPGEFVVIDNYAFLELNDKHGDVEEFQYQYFWKVERDPMIKTQILHNDTAAIDYIFVTEAMQDAFVKYDFPFLESYLREAEVIAEFGSVYPVKIYTTKKKNTLPDSNAQFY